jgi:hypothetical protein
VDVRKPSDRQVRATHEPYLCDLVVETLTNHPHRWWWQENMEYQKHVHSSFDFATAMDSLVRSSGDLVKDVEVSKMRYNKLRTPLRHLFDASQGVDASWLFLAANAHHECRMSLEKVGGLPVV